MSQPTGMEGFAQQAGALQGQSEGLRAEVESGQVVLDPEAAERLARFYEDKATDIAMQVGDAQALTRQSGYGASQVGAGMEQKFVAKANDGKAGVIPLLQEMQKTLEEMAETVRKAKRGTQQADEEAAHQGRKV